MTLNGAIKQLHELRNAEDIPIYYKPAITEVINVLLMDTQEVKHGRWIHHTDWESDGECAYECSVCGMGADIDYDFCMRCGAKMGLEEVKEDGR